MTQSDSGSLWPKNRLMYGGKEIKEQNEAKPVLQAAFQELSKVFTIKENNSQLLINLYSHQMIEKADFSRFNQFGNYTEWNINFYELLYNKSDLPKILNKLVNLNDLDLTDYRKHINQIFTSISTLKEIVSITDEVEDVEGVQHIENENSSLVESQHLADTNNIYQDNSPEHPLNRFTSPEQNLQQRTCPTVSNLGLSLTIVICTPVIAIGMFMIAYFILHSSCLCFEEEKCPKSAYFSSDVQIVTDNAKIIESRSTQFLTNDLNSPYSILVTSTNELTQKQLQICSFLYVNLTIDFQDPTHWHGFQLGCTEKIKILVFKGYFSLRNVEELLSQIPKELFAVEIYCDEICIVNECAAVQHSYSVTT